MKGPGGTHDASQVEKPAGAAPQTAQQDVRAEAHDEPQMEKDVRAEAHPVPQMPEPVQMKGPGGTHNASQVEKPAGAAPQTAQQDVRAEAHDAPQMEKDVRAEA